jgi:uncharacterized protein
MLRRRERLRAVGDLRVGRHVRRILSRQTISRAWGDGGIHATIRAVPTTAPVAAGERIDVLDAVRGVAVLSILLINIDTLSGYTFIPAAGRAALPMSQWDEATHFSLSLLVEAKFYSLFSFLFGIGFAVFVERAAARGLDPARLFKRRLWGLVLIGLAHTLFIWFGDILVTYAVFGFALLPFLHRSDRTVLRWAAGLLVAPIVIYGVVISLASLMPQASTPAEPDGGLPPALAGAVEKFAHGGYVQVVEANAVFTMANVLRRLLLMFFPRVLGMFLLGFYVQRRHIIANLEEHRLLVRRVFSWGMLVGLPLAAVGTLAEHDGAPGLRTFIEMTAKSIAAPSLALGYAAGLCVLFGRVRPLTDAFAPVGRLALSSYLLHSVAGVVVFYGIGFDWFGRVSLTIAVGGAIVFFAIQAIASRLWLSRAAYGPVEWLWRMFTYQRRFALLR